VQEQTNPYRSLSDLYAELCECWKALADMRTLEARYWQEKAEFLELIARQG
jgi:hypothetical protein